MIEIPSSGILVVFPMALNYAADVREGEIQTTNLRRGL